MISASAAYTAKNAEPGRCPIYQVKVYRRDSEVVTVPDPTSYWPLEETSGTRYDTIGTANLSPQNGPDSTAGILGNGSHHTQGDWDYFTAASQTALQAGPLDWSMSFWVRLDSRPTAGNNFMLAHKWSVGTASLREYRVRLNNTGGTYRFMFDFASNSGSTVTTVTASTFGTPVINTWYHIVVRHDVSDVRIYISVNGSANTNNTTYASTANTGAAPFQLSITGGSATGSHDGRLDEVGMWHGTFLSDANVDTLYNGGAAYDFEDFEVPVNTPVASWCTSWPVTGEDLGDTILVPISLLHEIDIHNFQLPFATLEFALTDLDAIATEIIASDGLVNYLVEFYAGFWDLTWEDSPVNYVQLFSGMLGEMDYRAGMWHVTARSRLAGTEDRLLFQGASSLLSAAMTGSQTTAGLVDAAAFDAASDFPESARGTILFEDTGEIAVYRGKSSNTLTSLLRSAYVVPPAAAAAASHSASVQVRQLIRRGEMNTDTDELGGVLSEEMHPIEMLKSLLESTGRNGIGEAEIAYDATSLDAVKTALGAVQFRFLHSVGIPSREFISRQLCEPCNMVLTENGAGELGAKLLYGTPAKVGAIADATILQPPQVLRKAEAIKNTAYVHYDFNPGLKGAEKDKFQSTYTYTNTSLVTAMGNRVAELHIWAKGIRALYSAGGQQWFGQTANFLADRTAALIDHFEDALPDLKVDGFLSLHLLECGDDIEATFEQAIDLATGDREINSLPMMISKVRHHYQAAKVELELAAYPVTNVFVSGRDITVELGNVSVTIT